MPRKRESFTVAIKRIFNREDEQGKEGFYKELIMLSKCKHPNIVSLLGYCDEDSQMILVYEHVAKGSLDSYLSSRNNKNKFTWSQRLKVCLEIAYGIDYLHSNTENKETIIHRDIKSDNILLGDKMEAKIADFGLSKVHPTNHSKSTIITNVIAGTPLYIDPEYDRRYRLKKESDIYSFGVVLFEILCGKLAYDFTYTGQHREGLAPVARKHFEERKLEEMVDPEIMNEAHEVNATLKIGPNKDSLDTFCKIAYQCLSLTQDKRPTSKNIIKELQKAYSYQEKWERELPEEDEKTMQLSESSSSDSSKSKNKIYNMLPKETPLQDNKVRLDGGSGERIEMVTAMEFLYMNHCSHRWQSLQDSRFQKVAEMLDTSNLMIEIKTNSPHFPGDYGVYLVFKFRDSRKFSSQPIYVNLKYKMGMGSETLHAYFATWRDEEWMMIELFRIINHKEANTHYEFLLESFSPCYCGDDAIYVAGIEFRAIDNASLEVKNEEIKKLQVQQLHTNSEEICWRSMNYDYGEKNIWQSEVNGKKHLMLSAKKDLLNFPNAKLFTSRLPTQSRFEYEVELLPQQVFYINCMIKSEMLSQDTEYACYLVFKLSEKCDGLHCPVKVRDLLQQENTEPEIIYFISPNPWNVHAITQVPKQREDGWMEVHVWKFNLNHEIENDSVPVNLKLMSYEGTMSGLIVCGLEFRPM